MPEEECGGFGVRDAEIDQRRVRVRGGLDAGLVEVEQDADDPQMTGEPGVSRRRRRHVSTLGETLMGNVLDPAVCSAPAVRPSVAHRT
jgi:hypothetical protein